MARYKVTNIRTEEDWIIDEEDVTSEQEAIETVLALENGNEELQPVLFEDDLEARKIDE